MSTEKPLSRRRYLTTAASAALAAGIFGVAGYYAGSSTAPAPGERITETVSTTLPLVTKPLKIGLMNDFSSFLATQGLPARDGWRWAAEVINGAGGILGRKLEIVEYDIPGWKSEDANTGIDRLAGVEKCVVVGNPGAAPSVMAVPGTGYDTVSRNKVPYYDEGPVCQQIIKENYEKYRYAFCHMSPATCYAIGIAEFYKKQLEDGTWKPQHTPPRIAILRGQGAYAEMISTAFNDWMKKYNWEVVHDETIPTGTVEYTSVLAKLRTKEPDFIHCSWFDATGLAALANQHAANPLPGHPVMYQQYGPSDPAYGKLTENYKNAQGVSYAVEDGLLLDWYGTEWRKAATDKLGYDPMTGTVADGWDALFWMKHVLEIAGSTDADDFIQAAENGPPDRGVGGGLTYNSYKKLDHMAFSFFGVDVDVNYYWHETTRDPSMGQPLKIYQIQDGVHIAVSPPPFILGTFSDKYHV